MIVQTKTKKVVVDEFIVITLTVEEARELKNHFGTEKTMGDVSDELYVELSNALGED